MKTKYLLPCDCDNPVAVDASQAGLTVQCNCGAKLKVPTMRGLAQCERVEQQVAQATKSWGVGQGAILLGAIVLLAGLLAGSYSRYVSNGYAAIEYTVRIDHDAHREDVEAMTPSQVWIEWLSLPRSLESIELEVDPVGNRRREAIIRQHATQFRRLSWVGFAVAAAGAAIAITGGFMAKGRPRKA